MIHIGFSQPEHGMKHIVTPEFELYGCYLAGTPFPLLGHKGIMLLTMFENDDIDFYREVNSPRDGNKYKTPAGFSDYTIERKLSK
jgi:penicillin amidase